MTPPRPRCTMRRPAARQPKNIDRRLRFSTKSHSSSVISMAGLRGNTPALFTQTSSPPSSSTARSARASTAAEPRTSARIPITWEPCSPASAGPHSERRSSSRSARSEGGAGFRVARRDCEAEALRASGDHSDAALEGNELAERDHRGHADGSEALAVGASSRCPESRSSAGSTASSTSGIRRASAEKAISPSRRASDAPRQKCGPCPKLRCLRASSRPDVELVRACEDRGVAIGAREHRQDGLAAGKAGAGEVEIIDDQALLPLHRRDPAKQLLNRGRGERGLGAQERPLVAVAKELDQPDADQVGGRLVPGEEQHHEHRGQLVLGQPLLLLRVRAGSPPARRLRHLGGGL